MHTFHYKPHLTSLADIIELDYMIIDVALFYE